MASQFMTVLGRAVIIIKKCKDGLWWFIPALFLRYIHINCSLSHLQTGFLSLYCSRGVKTSISLFLCGVALNSVTKSMELECL